MSEELPKGWAQAPISRVAIVNPRHPRDLQDTLEVSFAPMVCLSESSPAMEGLTHRFLGQVRTGFTHFAEGDVLFAKITPCMENGKGAVAVGLKNGLGCGTTELHVLRPTEAIDASYLYHFTHQPSLRKRAEARFTGSAGQARVPVAFFDETEIPIPPMAEQRRIVAKLEALLAKVDASRKRLERIPVILKRFRQAVLAAACDGRLTEDWCLAHPQSERVETTLGAIAVEFRTGPFGSALHQSDYISGGVPVINPTNIVDGEIVPNSEVSVSTETHKRLSEYSLRPGDIIIARRGEMGRCAVVGNKEAGWLCGTGSALIRVGADAIPDFIQAFISSPDTRRFLAEGAVGSTMANLNQGVFRSVPVNLPSVDEQREILRRIRDLNRIADHIEARYTKAKAQVDRLTQSILAKAFRGELVPQDPNDEPADALLSRLAAAPPEASATARRQGRPPRVQPAAPPVAPAPSAQVYEAPDREAPVLADLTLDAILQAHRDVLASIPSPLDEDQFLRAMALRLGFQRLGSRIKARLRFVLLQEGIRLS